MKHWVFAIALSCLSISCAPDDDANVPPNRSDIPKDVRAPSLRLEPVEFTQGTALTAHASFPQSSGAIRRFACSDPNNPTRIVEAEPGYDVVLIPLDEQGEEKRSSAWSIGGVPFNWDAPANTWIDQTFGPATIPEPFTAQRIRVALRFVQLKPSIGGNACTPVAGGSNIVQYDYRYTCAPPSADAVRGASRCRYVREQ
jgi:hypothetical protein